MQRSLAAVCAVIAASVVAQQPSPPPATPGQCAGLDPTACDAAAGGGVCRFYTTTVPPACREVPICANALTKLECEDVDYACEWNDTAPAPANGTSGANASGLPTVGACLETGPGTPVPPTPEPNPYPVPEEGECNMLVSAAECDVFGCEWQWTIDLDESPDAPKCVTFGSRCFRAADSQPCLARGSCVWSDGDKNCTAAWDCSRDRDAFRCEANGCGVEGGRCVRAASGDPPTTDESATTSFTLFLIIFFVVICVVMLVAFFLLRKMYNERHKEMNPEAPADAEKAGGEDGGEGLEEPLVPPVPPPDGDDPAADDKDGAAAVKGDGGAAPAASHPPVSGDGDGDGAGAADGRPMQAQREQATLAKHGAMGRVNTTLMSPTVFKPHFHKEAIGEASSSDEGPENSNYLRGKDPASPTRDTARDGSAGRVFAKKKKKKGATTAAADVPADADAMPESERLLREQLAAAQGQAVGTRGHVDSHKAHWSAAMGAGQPEAASGGTSIKDRARPPPTSYIAGRGAAPTANARSPEYVARHATENWCKAVAPPSLASPQAAEGGASPLQPPAAAAAHASRGVVAALAPVLRDAAQSPSAPSRDGSLRRGQGG